MERDEFEKLVADGYALIPDKFREEIANVAILIEDVASPSVRREQELAPDETLLGLYRGVPLTARGSEYGVGVTMPDTITLYQAAIEEEAEGDPERIRQVVADTIWHEFAHHFGLDEDAVRRRERERGVRD